LNGHPPGIQTNTIRWIKMLMKIYRRFPVNKFFIPVGFNFQFGMNQISVPGISCSVNFKLRILFLYVYFFFRCRGSGRLLRCRTGSPQDYREEGQQVFFHHHNCFKDRNCLVPQSFGWSSFRKNCIFVTCIKYW